MSSRHSWRIVSPAPRSAVLALAGVHVRVRRLALFQAGSAETVAVYRGDDPVAVAFFGRHGWRRTEMALAIAPDAAKHMRRLVRIAHLTLWTMAETRLIVASVSPANPAGQRMAALTGFRRARLKSPSLWVFRRQKDGGIARRRWGGEEGGGGKPPATADRE